MQTIRVHTGAMPETPLFSVYLCALRGAKALKVLIQAEPGKPHHHASDNAMALALKTQDAPESAFVAVYHENVTPDVSSRYGAPMGRISGNLDHSDYSLWRAKAVPLNGGGYDRGGAYWGLRARGERLFAVQDGMGNVAFVDACDSKTAIEIAKD